ncbi:MAG: thiamine pyrophosphate-binding protein [Spirochaetaceae bacterium]|nr:thiamine pyrophosphate-binding protein [Spirochaetaceae bacterium]
MTGGEVIHEVLVRAGVDRVFGVVSVHNLPIYDAIERGGRITAVAMRHEQAAVHAADGYARASGRLGVAVASTGPGAANCVPGLYEAGFASSPVLMITGQADTPNLGKARGFVHEADNQAAMLATVCRRVETVRLRQQLAPALMRVIDDIQTGRPQPGSLEVPIDLQYADREVTPAERAAVPVPEPVQPEQAAVEAAAELLAAAVRPLIIAGGGVVRSGGAQRPAGASAQLRALAEQLGAPVLVSANGRGALPDGHPLCLGNLVYHPEIRALREEADVVLAVGTRLQVGSEARNYAALGGKLIHLDADAGVIHRVSPAELAVVADAAGGLAAVTAALADRGGRTDPAVAAARQAWAARAAAARATVQARLGDLVGPDHFAIMEELRAATPRDTRLVRDSTVPAYLWANQMLPILEPRTSLHPTAGAIGPGLPLAIGAAVATGSRTVLIAGDGGFMLHVGELAVAAQYRLPVTICLFNDRGYGVLRRIEDARFAGRRFGVDLATPDFPALARSMGVEAHAVAGVEEFRTAFRSAADADGPVLLDIDLNALHPIGEYPPRPR